MTAKEEPAGTGADGNPPGGARKKPKPAAPGHAASCETTAEERAMHGITPALDSSPGSAEAAGAGHGIASTDEPVPLVDELGVEDLRELIFGTRGRLFSAAGRQSPVAEFAENYVILHPPQKPFEEIGPSEDIVIHVDDRGVLLNEIGQPRKIAGARFNGHELWWLGERMPDTLKHYIGWFDDQGKAHKLYLDGQAMTSEVAYRLRNRTHNGELSTFSEITTDQ